MKWALLMAAALAFLTPVSPGAQQEPPEPEVEELIVTARRLRHDATAATTACVWAALPEAEREPLALRAAVLANSGRSYTGPTVRAVPLSRAGVGSALRACGAPDTKEPVQFATAALRVYAVERATARALTEHRIGDAQLDNAWRDLSPSDRETLSEAGFRLYEGGGEDRDTEAAAVVVFGLVRRVRPVSAFNPFFYKRNPAAWRLVGHFASRATREALEKGF